MVDVKKGKMLKFVKRVIQDDIRYNTKPPSCGRKVYVIEDDSETGDGLVLVAFARELTNTAGNRISTFSYDGYKRCRWVKKEILANNCVEV